MSDPEVGAVRPRLLSLSALTLATALVLTACGGSDGADDAGSQPTSSPSASASESETPEAESAETPEALFERVSAAATAAGSVKTTFTTTSQAGDVGGSGTVRFGDDYAADLSVAVPGGIGTGSGRFRAVIVDETFYMQLGSEIGLPVGKTWISLTAGEENVLADTLAPILDSLSSAGDVEQSFAVLAAGVDLREEGTEQVDGVETTKYVVTVDVARAVASAGPAAASFQTLQDLGISTFDYTIWVDGEDLPRKYSQTFDIAGTTTTSEATYSDWGTEVDIAAPPAEQVASVAELLGTG